MHDPVDIRRRTDRLVARVDRRDDYGQLLARDQVIHDLDDVEDLDAWRAEIRRQARPDKIKVRTGFNDGIVRAWVVFGDKDDVGLFDDERRGLEGCRRVTSFSISDAGHFTLNTHPGEVAELILGAVCAAAQTPTQESSSRSSTAG